MFEKDHLEGEDERKAKRQCRIGYKHSMSFVQGAMGDAVGMKARTAG